jgi:uncharacterized caspase-like protein
MSVIKWFALFLLVFSFNAQHSAWAQASGQPGNAQSHPARHALVVGNAAYTGILPLTNPVNDATAVGRKLEAIGFKVTLVLDADRERLSAALERFAGSAAGADLSILYWAGHGLTIDGIIHVVPTDATGAHARRLISLESILKTLPPARPKLVFFDADISDPTGGRSGVSTKGFPWNTLISFASEGVVLDGAGKSSLAPYTAALLEHLDDPVDISIVLRRVRDRVLKSTDGKQQPWEYSSLRSGDLILSPASR